MKKKTKFSKLLFSIFATSLLVVSVYVPANTVYAENYLDTAPYIQPTQSNGHNILFDNTHGQTAGAADWVIDGGFSDYANGLASKGYYVTELRKNTPITYEDLENYDVFIIPEANIPYKTTEQAAILQYVQNGGSIFFIADHYNADRNKNRWDAVEVFNGYRRGAYSNPTSGMSTEEATSEAMSDVASSDWLANNFGVRFRYNALGDIDATNIVNSDECFGITENIDTVAMHAGSTIAILDPTIAKGIVYLPDNLTSSSKWPNAVDNGVYNGGGIAEGAYVAIAKVGQGKAAFIGDSSAVEDATPKYLKEETGGKKTTYNGYLEADDATLLMQLTNWLSDQESYTNFSTTGITLDLATTLYEYESPANSTEPQSEPWAAPSSGYKWYDATTFQSGSYGYLSNSGGEDQPEEQTYNIAIPTNIVVDQELPLTIYFSGLTANTIYDNFSVGAYLSGGTQIGKFTDLNGTYPNENGYSGKFSITTDSNGDASKVLVFMIDESSIGTFNLRLRQSSTNLLTQTCTITEPTSTSSVTYEMNYPTQIKAGMETAVTINIRNLSANETLSSLKIGSYLTGGTQIARFSIDGSTWTSSYGYSGTFSLTADAEGAVYKTVLMKINPSIVGDASLRIKKGSTNVLTKSISVVN
ncbi:MAG: DNA-binding protein [Lachnotalea sp.]